MSRPTEEEITEKALFEFLHDILQELVEMNEILARLAKSFEDLAKATWATDRPRPAAQTVLQPKSP